MASYRRRRCPKVKQTTSFRCHADAGHPGKHWHWKGDVLLEWS